MKNYNEINKIIRQVIKKMEILGNDTGLEEECPISIININDWEWAQGVGLYGLLRYYQETEDKETLAFLIEWFDKNIKKGLPEKNVNTMCPMLTLSYLCEYTHKDSYLEICKEWVGWIMEEMPRTEEMGLQHIVSGETNDQQIWDDTLFMTVLFLARMGKLLHKREYIDESVRQFLIHIKYLVDKKSGLLFHGWTFKERHNFAKALWGRGNCWYTVAVPDYIDIVGDFDEGVKSYLIETLLTQIKTLEKLQNDKGMWHTLLDDPNSYVETSATAGFAYGILKAVRLGYIDKKYQKVALKAVEAVLNRIKDNGTVMEVSYGTGMGKDLDFYRNIPLCPMTYGQALAIMMLTEALKI